MMLVLLKLVLVGMLVVVPALVGFFVGGSPDRVAWVTSISAFFVYALVGFFLKAD